MPRLHGSILPKKWRKKTFLDKSNPHRNVAAANGRENPGASNRSESHNTAVPRFMRKNDRQQHQGMDVWQSLYQVLANNLTQPRNSAINKDSLLKLTNILCIVYMMRGDIYAVTSGTGGKQTYFTPAPWSFLIWPVIHSLILGGCIYQFSPDGNDVLVDQVSWKLPLLHISNAIYIRCRSSQRYKYAFVWIVITYMVVNKIYRKMSKLSARGIRNQLFCHLSFSLYHGWVLGLMFLATFEAFGVDATTTTAHFGTKMSVLLAFLLIQLFEKAYASPATEGDFFACLAVSWFLFAITVEQSAMRSAFVYWSAHGVTTFSLCWITKCMIGRELKENMIMDEDEERAPLLGG